MVEVTKGEADRAEFGEGAEELGALELSGGDEPDTTFVIEGLSTRSNRDWPRRA
jgi:hypothetical protein